MVDAGEPNAASGSNIINSDLALTPNWWFWVDNATLVTIWPVAEDLLLPLGSRFPYSRLAITLTDYENGYLKDYYLYHQINQTTMIEEHYDSLIGHFNSRYINVKTS